LALHPDFSENSKCQIYGFSFPNLFFKMTHDSLPGMMDLFEIAKGDACRKREIRGEMMMNCRVFKYPTRPWQVAHSEVDFQGMWLEDEEAA